MRKAIFFDIDGTLIDMQGGIYEPTKKVGDALKKLQDAGHYIFIASGRPYAFIYSALKNFGFNGYVLSNGATVLVGDKVIFKHTLDKKIVREICDFAESENIEYVLEGHPNTYIRKNFTACEKFCNKIRVDLKNFVREFNLDETDVCKLECLSDRDDLENLDKAYKKILATEGMNGWADPFHYKSLEVYDKNISKATGILKALEYLNIDVKNSYAFGDGMNDVEMLQTVGTGFAMGTGKEDLKKVADYVVPSVHEDGVAFGVEKYILGGD